MSILARPPVAALAAKTLQRLLALAQRRSASKAPAPGRFPEFPGHTREIVIPTSVSPARAVVYLPEARKAEAKDAAPPPVHVNFHGGGFVLGHLELDDPLCRYLAAEAGVVVVNVDYVVAPQYPFPAPPRQVFEVVQWVAAHGAEQGWDGGRLTVGGQSAGGSLAAAAARQAFEQGGPPIALQVLHYPPLDLVTGAKDKPAAIPKPMLRPWMGEVFDSAYVPDVPQRADRLVSPAHPLDDADLSGIAPALVITAEYDRLRAEGLRYAERLRAAGALAEYLEVSGVDHGYDLKESGTGAGTENGTGTGAEKAREVYALIARHVRRATEGS
ncbi:alpha/beta hydrolase [Streptomyces sp. NPDC093109]|uniref:alpha/beta hydrolase n=1 Tax=Streptomyces sp. NPDC093109 TaxID=3154977 RepID=UPI00344E78AF